MRTLCLALVLSALAFSPAEAQEADALSPAPAAPWSPRIYLMDGGTHALSQSILISDRAPSVLAVIDKRWVYQPYPNADFWGVNLAKIKNALAAFASEAEKEQRVPAGKPRPLRILYIGSTFYGSPDAWTKQLDRLVKTAIVIVPSGNDPKYDASEIWTSRGIKIGFAPRRQVTGSGDQKKAIAVYLDFDPIEVYVPGRGTMPLSYTSTSGSLFAAHLANVLARGIGTTLTPSQIAAKLQAGFRGNDGHALILPEDELEAGITDALRH